MTQNAMPLSLLLADVTAAFTGVAAPPAAPELFGALDQAGWMATGYRLSETAAGRELTLALPPLPDGELVIPVPRLPLLALVFSAATLGDRPSVTITEPHGDAAWLELNPLRLALRLQTPLLRPVGGRPGVDLAFSGGLRLHRNRQVQLIDDAGLTLEPVEIGRTGIILSAEGMQLDLFTDRALPGVAALGLGADFQGLYARRGAFRLLPQSVFGDTPGLNITFQDVAIGTTGISASVRSYYDLQLNGAQIDPAAGLVGYLFDPAWQLGLAAVEIDVLDNTPRRFFIEGLLRVPVLDTALRCTFGLTAGLGQNYTTSVGVQLAAPTTIALGPGALTLAHFQADGRLGDDRFTLEGSLSGRLALPGFDLDVQHAAVAVEHTPTTDSLRLALRDVAFGPLGVVEGALLAVQSVTDDAGGQQWRVQMETTLAWADLHSRLPLADLPPIFPLPPDDARVTAYLEWESAPATRVTLRLAAALGSVDALWRGVPAAYRPRVADAALTLLITYQDTADFHAAGASSGLHGELAATFKLQLPDLSGLPGRDLFQIDSGDADGWVQVALRGGLRPDPATGNAAPYVEMEIANPLSIDVQLPGLAQAQAPIHTAITRVAFDLSSGSNTAGSFTLAGDFALRPVQPPAAIPFADHLARLLAPAQLSDLVGRAAFTLAFEDDRAALTLDARFENAEIAIDLFDMLANLARGLTGGGEETTDSPLDLEIGFGVRGVRLQIGSLDAAAAAPGVSLEMVIGLTLAGLSAELFFLLSDREFTVGLAEDFPIPLAMPIFPLAPADLDQLKDAGGRWAVGRWEDRLAELASEAAAITGTGSAAKEAKSHLLAQRFLLQSMLSIFKLLGGPANRQAYETYATTMIGLMHGLTSALHVDTHLKLVLGGRRRADGSVNDLGVKFSIPFADPRNIGVFGAAHLAGFGPDDPFRVLEGVSLGLGLTADMIFFSVDALSAPIEIPPIGRYDGGSINLSRLRIGFGYTRRSLAVNFAGAVRLPDQLVADADLSDVLGFGVRLPTHNALSFRLDLIPVTLGTINFVVPLLEFDLDLRAPQTVGLRNSATCEPDWDGLQFIVNGLYHDALKHVAFSPFFGMLPIPNLRFDGALALGDARNGATVVLNNVLALIGLWTGGTPVPIPLLAEPNAPYFENLCVNLRLAGFGIQFNLQRPFPSVSPLALLEVLGLLADPLMPIDPHGSLANTIRVSLTDGRLSAPPEIVRLFPELAGVVDKRVAVTVNLGTVMTAVQTVVRFGMAVGETLEETGRSLEGRLDRLRRQPPDLSLNGLLALLPPELRKFRVGGALAGFDARVVLALIAAGDLAELRAQFALRDQAGPAPLTPAFDLHTPSDAQQLTRFRPQLSAPSAARAVYPDDPANSLLRGAEFGHFSAADLADLPTPDGDKAGVVLGAHVKLFTGQRVRFFGYLFEDASFALISAVDLPPLTLPVAGISVTLPLQAAGRLLLSGRRRRDGYHGSITAAGYAVWNVIPGVARLVIASPSQPAQLALYGDGRFAFAGALRLELFGEAAVVDGSAAIDQSHCLVRGAFRYRVGSLIDWQLAVEGRIGPGRRFHLAGAGSLSVLGRPLADVHGALDETQASVTGRLQTGGWRVAGQEIACQIDLALHGRIDVRRRTQPAFLLEGEGSLTVFGAQIHGRGGLRRHNNRLTTWLEGALRWQGRDWLGGRIELGDDGVALSGHTAFALDLTPSVLAGIQLARLHFQIELGGSFTLDTQAGLAGFDLRGRWSLAARLPGSSEQVFPLAVQEVALSGQTALELELIHVTGFQLIPFDGIQIPLPTIAPVTPPSPVRFGKINGNPAASWSGVKVELAGGVFPVVTSGALSNAQTERRVYLNYKVNFDANQTLPLDLGLDDDFRLALVWRNNRLQLKVTRGNQVWHKNL